MNLIQKIKSLFSKKILLTRETRPGYKKFFMGGVWGNQIGWVDPREFGEPREFFTVAGIKNPLPEAGDVLFYRDTEGRTLVFIFAYVERIKSKEEPDMFKALVGFSTILGEETLDNVEKV